MIDAVAAAARELRRVRAEALPKPKGEDCIRPVKGNT